MTDEPRPASPPDARRDGTPLARRFCPRCGAELGALAAGRVEGVPAPALYCGCCGLVVSAP